MNTFELTVVTPSGELFSTEKAEKVQVRTRSGQITILAKHTPLVSVLAIGQLIVSTTEGERRLAIFGGFIEVRESGEVIVLADEGERPAEIDVAEAKAARDKTQKLISDNQPTDEEVRKLQTNLKRSVTRLKVGGWYSQH